MRAQSLLSIARLGFAGLAVVAIAAQFVALLSSAGR